MAERLQKLLAAAGIGSRRQIEAMLEAGRISINGTVVNVGAKAEPSDTIRVDGQIIKLRPQAAIKHRVLAYNKPEGEICTRSDPEGRETIFANLPKLQGSRWITIGRLDINTSGLLLVTTDGELANRLMHPSSQIEREYAVRVMGEVDAVILQRLQQGVELEDGKAHFESVVDVGGQGANHWYHVIIREGRKREVRRLWESQGLVVSRLTRVRYGSITLRRGLKPGKFDELDQKTIDALRVSVGLAPLLDETPAPRRMQRKQPGARQGREGRPSARRR